MCESEELTEQEMKIKIIQLESSLKVSEIKEGNWHSEASEVQANFDEYRLKHNEKISGYGKDLNKTKAEISRLNAWKESAIRCSPPLQDIARELDVKIGEDIPSKILPAIIEYKDKIVRLTNNEQTKEINMLNQEILKLRCEIQGLEERPESNKELIVDCIRDLKTILERE